MKWNHLSLPLPPSLSQVLEVPSGTSLATLQGHTRTVLHCQFTPEGHTLITSSEDTTIRVGPFSFFLILLSSLLLLFCGLLFPSLCASVHVMFSDCSTLSPLTALLYCSTSLNISSHLLCFSHLLSSVFRTACPLLDLSAYQKYTHYPEHHLAANQNSTASLCIHLTLYYPV